MNSRYNLIDRESWQPFFSLLLFCGIALILSIPAARQVRHFERFPFLSGIPVFFYAHALFMGILGLNVGGTSAARGEHGRVLLPLLGGRVLLAQVLILPYLLFERALYPGREGAFFLIFLYTSIVSLLCAATSRLLEGPWARTSARGFLLKYALFTLYYTVPLVSLPVLSPLGAVTSFLYGERAALLLLAHAFPLALLSGVFLLLNRRAGRDQGV